LGLPIFLPPLRERGNDILVLAKYFADNFCKENNLPAKTFSGPAQEKLLSYSYPGNVRELKAITELAVVMSGGDVVDEMDISFSSQGRRGSFLMDEEDTLKGYTRKIIRAYLDKYDNNIIKVAKKLDVGKSTIYRMLKNNEL